MTNKAASIPKYDLKNFRPVHRQETDTIPFGYNGLQPSKIIDGFELYSSDGLVQSVGPLKSAFYRMSITVSGSVDMQIGLEHYKHEPCTLSFTFPNQIFSKNNIAKGTFGYYLLFNPDFLNELIPSLKMAAEFPFFDLSGLPVFRTSEEELGRITDLVKSINGELQAQQTGRIKAIKSYLYLLLLEAKRSYERQGLGALNHHSESYETASRFKKLVSQHYLSKRGVADYAALLAVSPDHLNRVVKNSTGQTASAAIKEMLLLEAKSLLRYTVHSVAEIAYQLDFADPSSFNRFFKTSAGTTPLAYRKKPE